MLSLDIELIIHINFRYIIEFGFYKRIVLELKCLTFILLIHIGLLKYVQIMENENQLQYSLPSKQ